jgi:hypothetical protein
MKSNYGPTGEVVRLRWRRGVFVPEGCSGSMEEKMAAATVDRAYLDCLDAVIERGRRVGPYPGKNFAPAVFEKMSQANGCKRRALGEAQERLFTAKRIKVVTTGPASKQRTHIAKGEP